MKNLSLRLAFCAFSLTISSGAALAETTIFCTDTIASTLEMMGENWVPETTGTESYLLNENDGVFSLKAIGFEAYIKTQDSLSQEQIDMFRYNSCDSWNDGKVILCRQGDSGVFKFNRDTMRFTTATFGGLYLIGVDDAGTGLPTISIGACTEM